MAEASSTRVADMGTNAGAADSQPRSRWVPRNLRGSLEVRQNFTSLRISSGKALREGRTGLEPGIAFAIAHGCARRGSKGHSFIGQFCYLVVATAESLAVATAESLVVATDKSSLTRNH